MITPSKPSNINGEKIVVARDSKITEKAIEDAAARLAQAEIEDNDLAFEKFLVSLDNNVGSDFLVKEFDLTKESDDLGHFDKLQQKILVFCQNNIRDLTDAFKTVANNRVDAPAVSDEATNCQSKGIVFSESPSSPNSIINPKVENSNNTLYHDDHKDKILRAHSADDNHYLTNTHKSNNYNGRVLTLCSSPTKALLANDLDNCNQPSYSNPFQNMSSEMPAILPQRGISDKFSDAQQISDIENYPEMANRLEVDQPMNVSSSMKSKKTQDVNADNILNSISMNSNIGAARTFRIPT